MQPNSLGILAEKYFIEVFEFHGYYPFKNEVGYLHDEYGVCRNIIGIKLKANDQSLH